MSLALVGTYFVRDRGRAYGIYNAINGAGCVVSPIVGGAIVLQADFAAIFPATAAVGGLAFVLSAALPQPAKEPEEVFDDDDDLSWSSFVAVFREPALLPWYLVIVANMFLVGILYPAGEDRLLRSEQAGRVQQDGDVGKTLRGCGPNGRQDPRRGERDTDDVVDSGER